MSIPLLVTQRSATPGGGAARACRSTMRRKIVVAYPPHDVPALGPRLCALALAAPLLSHGFVVVITDAAIDDDVPQRILRRFSNALSLGISVPTGSMITSALHIARMAGARAFGA
jgi:hypothetical protein